jgi:uncharacterized protein YecA (UPF0149 family)
MWNPLKAIKDKIAGAPVAGPSGQSAPSTSEGDSLQSLEKQGLMGKFFRHWKNPRLLRQIKAAASRMQAEGVNIKDRKAVEAWLKSHQKEIESGEIEAASQAAKPHTYVKTGPDIGRNDPCHCGSGKKYKKCHGAKV